jgi:uncharacterized protein
MPSVAGQHRLAAVPLFPLPNVVLFPRAVLPLHIFEQRYREMVADALEGDRLIAMALLRPGWEKHYYARPEIEPIVCVGTILTHELLPDGKYNLLLQGTQRARIVCEHGQRAYRVADLVTLEETPIAESDLASHRQQLVEIFSDAKFAVTSAGRQFLQILMSPLPTSDVADLLAFNLLEDVGLKQSLLADPDIRRRVARVIEAMHAVRSALAPPPKFDAPSLN